METNVDAICAITFTRNSDSTRKDLKSPKTGTETNCQSLKKGWDVKGCNSEIFMLKWLTSSNKWKHLMKGLSDLNVTEEYDKLLYNEWPEHMNELCAKIKKGKNENY